MRIIWNKDFKPKSVKVSDMEVDDSPVDAEPVPIVGSDEITNVKPLDPKVVSKHQWSSDKDGEK